MFNLSPSLRIFIYTKPTDMRNSFDGLVALVRNGIKQDPLSGDLFLFGSRRGDLIKIIWWDADGYAIYSKRLEIGTFRLPPVRFLDGEYAPVEIERADLLLLLEGIDTDSVRRLKRYRRKK